MLTDIFTKIYKENLWKSQETRSGKGAEIAYTENVRAMLPIAIRFLGIKYMLDAGCGDYNWMRLVKADVDYTGCDVVQEIIDKNNELYADDTHRFFQADISVDELPCVDLILCRCILYHLPYEDITKVIRNFKRSGSTYLLTTTMPSVEANTEGKLGGYRQMNLNKPPFNFPMPMFYFYDSPITLEVLALYTLKDIEV